MLAKRLRSERHAHSLSQHQLAAIGAIQPNAQGHYENGARRPRADYLLRIYAAGLDVRYILTGERTRIDASALSDEEQAFLRSFRLINLEERHAFEQILSTMASGIAPRS